MPAISVLMPAFNAEQHVLQSIQSVLSQTFEDFELIIIDDASTDRTSEIIQGIGDRRLRIFRNARNLGIVGSLNRAMSLATGRYIARIDADDYCLPTRFAKQYAFLEANERSMIVSTNMSVLDRGGIRFSRTPAHPDAHLMRWMLHVSNPVGHPSMMFRADVVQRLGCYLREDFKYAEDFDFSHRVLRVGEISAIPEYLVIYRQHAQNLTLTRRGDMIEKSAAVLRHVYEALLGPHHDDAAALVARHLIAGDAVLEAADFERLGGTLNTLIAEFDKVYGLNAAQREFVIQHAGKLWWQAIQRALRERQFSGVIKHCNVYRWSQQTRPSSLRLARSSTAGLLRLPSQHPRGRGVAKAKAGEELSLSGVQYREIPVRTDDPPCLYVVVDTEAEFDWAKEFESSALGVSAMSRQFLAQSIFDKHGVRPIYLVDYAVASQPQGYEPLLQIFKRHGCAIGAHLHPWINPPLEEELSERNSFAGNLPTELEESKLRILMAQIQASFKITPLFFKAGRYGIGPNTMAILRRSGFEVDFSIMPLADMRSKGGPDFRWTGSLPYAAVDSGIVSIPMTRSQVGLAAPIPRSMHAWVHSGISRRLRVPGILSRLQLLNTVTLTPEGMTVPEQIQLIKTNVAAGQRAFVLHYHSPSLGMHTPYVTNPAELESFLQNITSVCDFFFEKLGGYPGNPADLVPQGMREMIWPRS